MFRSFAINRFCANLKIHLYLNIYVLKIICIIFINYIYISFKVLNDLLKVVIEVNDKIPCNLAFIRVCEIYSKHIALEVIEKVKFWQELLIAIGVCQSSLHHEKVVECTKPVN